MVRSLTFLQANINHCAAAQDLLLQAVAERLITVAVVAEPYTVPSRPDWVGDLSGMVALTTQSPVCSPPFDGIVRRQGFVAATLGGLLVVGVYFSPNRALAEFVEFLEQVGTFVGQNSPRPIFVLGDFNAKSTAWGCPRTVPRGRAVEAWLAELGLAVVNRGVANTCVRRDGGSIVDVTFATPDIARRIRDWEVLVGEETLSDHRYIRFSVSPTEQDPVVGGGGSESDDRAGPRWALKRLDAALLQEAALVEAWNGRPSTPVDLDAEAGLVCEAMVRICDAAMPRARAPPTRRQVYWWSEEIAELRRSCVAMRRRYQRYRRRRRPETAVSDVLYDAYRAASKALRVAIKEAKASAWRQLLETLDRDPWGRPYHLVRRKLRQWAAPVTETLEPPILRRVVEGLFPAAPETSFAPPMAPHGASAEERDGEEPPPLSVGELGAAVLRMRAKNTAPGPDGIPGRAWALALGVPEIESRVRDLFSRCFREGRFPRRWKVGRLVLLRKEGRPADQPAGYRPIVLLDEVGKLLERVTVARLTKHLDRVGPNLADSQFGFRRGRSTIDAIARVRDLSEEACSSGGVMLAVSLDIANAFNTLPWTTIVGALEYHRVPSYLSRLVGDYLSEREVVYPTTAGLRRSSTMRGVPQGSALGPLLWNIGYDWVLRAANLRGVDVVCYADDTLVTARGKTFREASIVATAGVAAVVQRIRQLGLEVALAKSEAIVFHGPRGVPPRNATIVVGGVSIPIGTTLKYLGVVLDGRWRFGAHLRQLSPKLIGAASALGRLLPNLGGGGMACRRLYSAVVRSMALYGAPIWAASLQSKDVALLYRAQRVMAVRVCRGYRTLSHEVACALAGSLPWDLEAGVLSSVFWRTRRARDSDSGGPSPREVEVWRRRAKEDALIAWRDGLLMERPQRGTGARRLLRALGPVIQEWVGRKHGVLTFRLTQVLSGHGCFGRYLCGVVRREATPVCHQCGAVEDTSQHVLEACPGCAEPRRSLVAVVGGDLSLPAVLQKMVDSDEAWQAMASFCEIAVSQKESDERERERNPLSHPLRRVRRRGRAVGRSASPGA